MVGAHGPAPVRHPVAPGGTSDCSGLEYGDEPGYLRSYAKTLRKKIEDDPAYPRYLLTEPWVGCRFHDPSDPTEVGATVAEEVDNDG